MLRINSIAHLDNYLGLLKPSDIKLNGDIHPNQIKSICTTPDIDIDMGLKGKNLLR